MADSQQRITDTENVPIMRNYKLTDKKKSKIVFFQARARARRACALRALGLLPADGAPAVGGGKTF